MMIYRKMFTRHHNIVWFCQLHQRWQMKEAPVSIVFNNIIQVHILAWVLTEEAELAGSCIICLSFKCCPVNGFLHEIMARSMWMCLLKFNSVYLCPFPTRAGTVQNGQIQNRCGVFPLPVSGQSGPHFLTTSAMDQSMLKRPDMPIFGLIRPVK